jgi:hypothetical protein
MRRRLSVIIVFLLVGGCATSLTPTARVQPTANTTSLPVSTMTISISVVSDDRLPPTAKAELDHLNNWITDAMDLSSCPVEYSQQYSKQQGREIFIRPSGEANGWIYSHEERLDKLGYRIRWNCEKGKFETIIAAQKPPNICSCQRPFTTPTP